MNRFEADLRAIVGEAHVTREADVNFAVTPGSSAEIEDVIKRCTAERAIVVPLGSGNRPAPANTRATVRIATRRLNHILQLDEVSQLAHVQAGVTGIGLERELVGRGLSLGDYPPAVMASTLGGIVAVRTPGKSSARHGFFEDAVIGLSAVLGNGRTVHTRIAPRRASGPDLGRALCGSEGTIGFITSLVVRLHRRPEARFHAAFRLPTVDAAIAAVHLALREEAQPSGVRIYDSAEAHLHFAGAAGVAAGEALLCASTAGPTDLAACDRELVRSAVLAEGGAAAPLELAELWWRRLHAGEATPGPAPTFEVMATPSRLAGVYHAVTAAVARAGGRSRAHISRFDADGAIAFFTLEADGATPPALLDIAHHAATRAGGWLLGARATRFDVYLARLRERLDPYAIMNPSALAVEVPHAHT